MKTTRVSLLWRILASILCPFLGLNAFAADKNPSAYTLAVTPDRADGIYRRGEQVTFTIAVSLRGTPVNEARVRWTLSKDGKDIGQTGEAKLAGGRATVRGQLDEPGFLQCRADITPPGEKLKTVRAAAAIDPLDIPPSLPAPDDFDAFWAAQKRKLASLPLNVRLTPVKSPQGGVECFDLQADGLGGPLSAYLARPVGAKAGSLPAIVLTHGAGVASSRLSVAARWAQDGLLALDFNAHGLPNGQPREFYTQLSCGDLKDYFWKGRDSREPTEPSHVSRFGPDRVRLIEASPFKQRQELHRTVYLRSLEPDRLLAPFFHNAKLPWDAKRYPGWDSGFIEGHMGGHFLSAASRMYAATGDASYKAKVAHVLAGLRKCQQALDQREPHRGYLSAFPVAKLEQLEAVGHGGSVPYYTLHKILAGLLDAHAYCDNPQALDLAVGLSDYIAWRMSRLSAEQVAKMLETNFRENPGNEHGGIAEALVDLSVQSKARGDADAERHVRLASLFLRDWFINPLAAGEDRLSGLHGNTHTAIASGLARFAAVTGDPRAGTAARQFWEHVTGYHSFVNGGNSFDEKLRDRGVEVSGTGNSSLASGTAEYCNTHNMLKLTRNLFELSPRAEYAEYYERALYNHILATIEPRTGQVCYLTSLRPGDFRSYLPADGTFCCNGTGLENPARFGEGIYFHQDDTLWVKLYIPSVLDWRETGITLRQEAKSPFDETVRFSVGTKQPVSAKLRLRIPQWATGENALSLEGKLQPIDCPAGSYAEIARIWRNGDAFELRLPLRLWSRRATDDPQVWSFFYGPVLLAAALGSDTMPSSDTGDKWFGLRVDGKANGEPTAAYERVPVLLADHPENPASCLKAVPEKPLQFQAPGTVAGRSTTVTLCPLYAVHHQRFAVYLKVMPTSAKTCW